MNDKGKKSPFVRAVPEVKSKSPERKYSAARAAVPEGGSENPQSTLAGLKAAVPTGRSENPQSTFIAAKAAVPNGGSRNPEKKSANIRAAEPTGKSADPLEGSVTAKSSVPTGGSENPQSTLAAAKGAVPTGRSRSPEEKSVTAKAAEAEAAQTYVKNIAGWKGLNRRQTLNSGALSEAKDITFDNYPYVESATATEIIKMCDETETEDNQFKIVKVIATETPYTVETVPIGVIYDAAVRGNEFFLIGEEGYVYGQIDDGKIKYIGITETIEGLIKNEGVICDIKTETRKKQKALFVESFDVTDIGSIKITRQICLFGKFDRFLGEYQLPVLSGEIEFVSDFLKDIYFAEADDTDKIYAVVKEGENKAGEVWKYIYRSVDKKHYWHELRRDIFIRDDDGRNDAHICLREGIIASGEKLSTILEWSTAEEAEENVDIDTIDTKLKDHITLKDPITGKDPCSICHITADDIYGAAYTRSMGGGDNKQYNIKNYILKMPLFSFSETKAPVFDRVVWYKTRVFGSVDNYVIASEYNKPNGWTLDTSGSINAAHAWLSTSSANTRADGDIYAMAVYMDRIEVLKKRYQQEILGSSNPFSIQDVYAIGTEFERGCCEAYGRFIITARDNMYYYSGGLPRVFGREVGVNEFTYAVTGGRGEKYYIYCKDENGEAHLFVYDFVSNVWSERNTEGKEYFMLTDIGGKFVGITTNGEIYRFDGGDDGKKSEDWSFETEDMTEGSLDVKRIQKIKLYYEIGAGAEVRMYTIMRGKRGEKECYHYHNKADGALLRRGEVTLTNSADYNLKLRFEGRGHFKLMSLEFVIKNGGKTTNDG